LGGWSRLFGDASSRNKGQTFTDFMRKCGRRASSPTLYVVGAGSFGSRAAARAKLLMGGAIAKHTAGLVAGRSSPERCVPSTSFNGPMARPRIFRIPITSGETYVGVIRREPDGVTPPELEGVLPYGKRVDASAALSRDVVVTTGLNGPRGVRAKVWEGPSDIGWPKLQQWANTTRRTAPSPNSCSGTETVAGGTQRPRRSRSGRYDGSGARRTEADVPALSAFVLYRGAVGYRTGDTTPTIAILELAPTAGKGDGRPGKGRSFRGRTQDEKRGRPPPRSCLLPSATRNIITAATNAQSIVISVLFAAAPSARLIHALRFNFSGVERSRGAGGTTKNGRGRRDARAVAAYGPGWQSRIRKRATRSQGGRSAGGTSLAGRCGDQRDGSRIGRRSFAHQAAVPPSGKATVGFPASESTFVPGGARERHAGQRATFGRRGKRFAVMDRDEPREVGSSSLGLAILTLVVTGIPPSPRKRRRQSRDRMFCPLSCGLQQTSGVVCRWKGSFRSRKRTSRCVKSLLTAKLERGRRRKRCLCARIVIFVSRSSSKTRNSAVSGIEKAPGLGGGRKWIVCGPVPCATSCVLRHRTPLDPCRATKAGTRFGFHG